MGRKAIDPDFIKDHYNRRITFKKRRTGLLKKAMQLSTLAGCDVSLSVFWKEDDSLLEYASCEDLKPIN